MRKEPMINPGQVKNLLTEVIKFSDITPLLYFKSVLYRTVLNRTVLTKTVLDNRTKFSFLTVIYRTKFSLRRPYEMEA